MTSRALKQVYTFTAVLAIAVLATVNPQAQGVAAEQRQLALQHALERLSGYGVFDFLAFSLDRGTATLVGYAYNPRLKVDAAKAARAINGVDDVVDNIEVLPASMNDDRIRQLTFYNLYTDSFLSRYTSGGPRAALYEAIEFGRWPGRQPFGTYPIHIVVAKGRTTLLGVVDNESDRRIAELRAREVGGVFAVTNDVIVKK